MTWKLLEDLFMGPHGTPAEDTWQIGRIYSVPMLTVGLSIPIVSMLQGQPISMIDVGGMLAGVAGACVLLIKFNNQVDLPPPGPPKHHTDGDPPHE